VSDFLNLLGAVSFQLGEMERAEEWFSAALRTAEREGDPSRRAAALVNLGAVANVRGRFDQALARYRRGRRSYHRAGNALGEARALHNLGLCYADLKRWRRAAECYRTALRLASGEDPMLAGFIALNASEVHLALDQLEIARQRCDEAADRLIAMEAWVAVADVDRRYGEIFRRMGKPGLAREHLRRAARRGREFGSPLIEAEALRALGQVHVEGGALEEALECYGRALALFRSLEAGHELADTVIIEIVEVMSRRIEAWDARLFGHSARVARYAAATAERMGLDRERVVALLVAGYLHDIGKLQVDSEVLAKPEEFTLEERARVQRHTAAGAEHVARYELPWDIAPIVRSHHEEYDGSGYPDRLAGEEIPLEARILHVADVFDALVSPRPWRGAWSREDAIAYVELSAGRSFDPTVVEAFLAVLQRSSAHGEDGQAPMRLAEAIANLPSIRLVAA
jgi:putative nucleotidyltransferase with HDIG domain